jgi:hypothetical protein
MPHKRNTNANAKARKRSVLLRRNAREFEPPRRRDAEKKGKRRKSTADSVTIFFSAFLLCVSAVKNLSAKTRNRGISMKKDAKKRRSFAFALLLLLRAIVHGYLDHPFETRG